MLVSGGVVELWFGGVLTGFLQYMQYSQVSLIQGSCEFELCRIFTPQPLRAVGVLFSPMVSGWAGSGKKFVRAVSQKPQGVAS